MTEAKFSAYKMLFSNWDTLYNKWVFPFQLNWLPFQRKKSVGLNKKQTVLMYLSISSINQAELRRLDSA